MKLVEELSGIGQLIHREETLRTVRYSINRYQGMAPSGLPIPGLFRIEGTVHVESPTEFEDYVDIPLVLRLADGRALRITLADRNGRVLSEGHGPMKCVCC